MPYIEYKGTISHLGEVETRQTRNGGTWEKQTVVVRIQSRNNSFHEIAAVAEGRTVGVIEHMNEGDLVNVSAFISCREYNGRYYNDVALSSIVPAEVKEGNTATPPPTPKEEKKEDDLPF